MTAEEIKNEIKENGYIHIPFPQNLDLNVLTEIFGKQIFTTLVKENPNSSRLLSSNQDVDLHTDHIKANYIAWQCNSQAALGGESVLLDSSQLLKHASDELLHCLGNVFVKSHRLFYDDKSQYPLYSIKEQIIYYASFLCESPTGSKEKQALSWFQNELQTAKKIEIKLSEGDWLIIDNHRMLHGRKGFEKKSNRLLTRYWLSGQAI